MDGSLLTKSVAAIQLSYGTPQINMKVEEGNFGSRRGEGKRPTSYSRGFWGGWWHVEVGPLFPICSRRLKILNG